MDKTKKPIFLVRKSGLDPLVGLGLAGVLLFFVLSAIVAYLNLQTLQEDNQKIIRSHDVIVAFDRLLSSMQDAETGQRGYLLTGNDKYLERYHSALSAIPSGIAAITQLTADNPVQQRRAADLKPHVDARLARLKEAIDLRRDRGQEAGVAIVNLDRGKSEMDAVRADLSAMAQTESELREKRVAEMNDAYRTALASGILSGLLGIAVTFFVGFLIRRSNLARRRDEWLQAGQVGLGAAMRGEQATEELGNNILSFLARHLGAVAGAIFVENEGRYRRSSTYGVPPGSEIVEEFGLREGLLGQAAAEGNSINLTDIPDGYLTFGSALGRKKPRHLVISPASIDGNVNSVLEFGFIRKIDQDVATLLQQASPAIAIAVRSANYRIELQRLLEDTQRKSEELQVQGEELRVSNEELEEQSRALKESQARLEQQQVELEQTNSQLEEQTQQLESQRDDLERANASVQLKARELEQASQYKSDFLANMSHELRTPLNSSLILAKLLADNPHDNLTDEQVKYAQTIQSSGNDLLNLINDILDLSKIEAGHVDIRPEPVPIERLLSGLRQLFQPVAQEKNLDFAINVPKDCPELVLTDPQRLEQILKNLLSNAFKFTEGGRVSLSLRRDTADRISFAVTDTGIGISEEQQKRVFGAFHQADGTINRRYGGTGLGLSISRELARLLGGSIQLESREGHGSTFTLSIPAAYDPAIVAPRVAEEAALSAPIVAPVREEPRSERRRALRKVEDDRHSVGDGRRILLIVEDDESFAGILRDLSREMGFRSLVANTAEEALSLAREFMPNAVILDVGLPDQSGLSVLDRLKRDVRTRHIPIHVVSASDHSETALSMGAVGYMLKPVKREQIAEILGKLEARLSQRIHRILIVEDDPLQREAVAKLLSSDDVETVIAGTAAECLERLREQTFDCMVLDLSLPDASGYCLLETLSREEAYSFPPVIVYTGRDLSADDEQRLRRYSKSIIIKGAKSPERLIDEVTLFLHQIVSELPDEQQRMIRKALHRDALLEGRRILVVEDDVRNVYALTNILEPRGAAVAIARNGQEALDALDRSASDPALAVDLILMDVMMPVMDGLTATRKIRQNPVLKKLPIIMLTAKAMPDDQQRCIDAGANDYMAKPLDVEKLLSLVRVWIPR
jgi:signal transduction histidine kinase/DNA-binding response OmpR family regulator/CHASE3 domain sensor protein